MDEQSRTHVGEDWDDGGSALFAFMHPGDATPSLRRALILRGVLAAIAGAAVLTLLAWRPVGTLVMFGVFAGAFFLAAGIIRLITGIVAAGLNAGMRALNIVLGLLVGAIGFLAILNPGFGLLTMAVLIGVAWIFEGVAALSMLPSSQRGIWVFFGIVSLLAGLVIIAMPWASVEPLVIVTGVFLVVFGIADVVGGARMARRAAAA
jgi:uncharacterized membrane protein HdeD (DUF308 family)